MATVSVSSLVLQYTIPHPLFLVLFIMSSPKLFLTKVARSSHSFCSKC